MCSTQESWPYKPRPGPIHREKWQRFLDQLCQVPTLWLKRSLGAWYGNIQYKWQAYFDPKLTTVILKNGPSWDHYSVIQKQRRHWSINKTQMTIDHTPPTELEDLIPMDIICNTSTRLLVIPPMAKLYTSPPSTQITTWTQYLSTLPTWESRILTEVSPAITNIWQDLHQSNPQWKLICDGSFVAPKALYCWKLYDGNNIIYTGTGMAPGNPATAFRAELYSIVTWYSCMYHTMTYFDLQSNVQVIPYTDNTKVLD